MYSNAIVYVVDDADGIRHSLSLLLESVKIKVETSASAQEFIDIYDSSVPGCLVLDIRMPEMSGLELQKKLIEDNINIPIIIITGHGDVSLAVRAMKAGAVDFIEKPFNDQVLLDSISSALDKSIQVFDTQQDCADFNARVKKISPREQEVMDLLVKGKSAKEIALCLGISSKTVDVHRGHILEKMQLRSVPELVRMVIMHGKQTVSC
jgi:FixJ family two-component response regulator